MTSNHGGPRTPGPGKKLGRPRKPDAKVPISGRVSPKVAEYLREHGLSATVESVISRTKHFRKWLG